MRDARISELQKDNLTPSRPNLTQGVFGANIIPDGLSDVRVIITRVEPEGEFQSHKDSYHHVFYFIDGTGIGWIGDEEYEIFPGRIVEIPAGVIHGYKNTSPKDLLLITVNIPTL